MKHKRTKTAHLQMRQACDKKGLNFHKMINRSISNNKHRSTESVSEEIYKAMAHKESLRKGWKSVIKDKRL